MMSSQIFQSQLNSSLLPVAFSDGMRFSEASPLLALDLITTV